MNLVPRSRYLLFAPLAVVLVLLVPGVGSATTLNSTQLDYGYCGQNLQRGSDPTASNSSTPSFVLAGDGGAASYQISIDGSSIGTFGSDTAGNVCIRTTAALANGAHVLTGSEVRPNPANGVPAFNFSVDTVPPPAPSAPALTFTNDTGVKGDNITSLRTFTITGTAATGAGINAVDAYWGSGSRYFGGTSLSNGTWSLVGSVPGDGVYALQASAVDEANNASPLSTALTVTVDSTPPASALTSPATGATVSGTVNAAATASDSGSGVASVAFAVDGVTKATDTASPYTYAWNTTTVANGQHTVTETATDVAGNKTTSSVTVTVQNGSGPTVPGAPTLTAATAGNNSVAIAWSAPSSNGGSAITGYKVYRGTTSGGETLLTTLGNITSFTDATAANGTTYYYKVSALNAVGEGATSNELFAKPATVPGAPTLSGAAPGNASVSLTWSAPGSNGGSPVTAYRVYRGTTSGGETLLTTLGNVSGWTDTTVTNGTTYYYKVSAVNSVGEGVASNELSAKPAASATAPGAPTLTAATPGSNSVALAWSAPSANGGSAITGYKVYRGTTSGGETLLATLGNVLSWTDTTAVNGTTYYYKVSAVNSVGEGAASNELSARPATVPGAPTLTGATPGNASVALAWSAPGSNGGSAVTGYRIYRGTTSGGETLLTTLGNVAGWTDTSVANGTTYYYKVSALNSVGEGAASNELSARPSAPGGPPSAPTLEGAAPGHNSVVLAWGAPASDGGSPVTGYKIYRGTTSGGETLLTAVGNVLSWTDTTAVDGTVYYYKVSAVNAAGEGTASNELSARPATVPGAPALTSASNGTAGVSLAWTAPGSNGGSPVTGYKIYRGTTSGGEALVATVANVTSWIDTNVANGSTYYYKVSAINAMGESARSNELSVKVTGNHK